LLYCGNRELGPTCLSAVHQLCALVRLSVSPNQLNDQVLLNVADNCVNLQRLVLVDDRYSDYVSRRAADVKRVSAV